MSGIESKITRQVEKGGNGTYKWRIIKTELTKILELAEKYTIGLMAD